jgi:antitoxin VapB
MIMKTAKLFKNGSSQAVRLPAEFRFEGKEVFIKRVQAGVLLIPKQESFWEDWEANFDNFKAFMPNGRKQPAMQQAREGIDEIFT